MVTWPGGCWCYAKIRNIMREEMRKRACFLSPWWFNTSCGDVASFGHLKFLQKRTWNAMRKWPRFMTKSKPEMTHFRAFYLISLAMCASCMSVNGQNATEITDNPNNDMTIVSKKASNAEFIFSSTCVFIVRKSKWTTKTTKICSKCQIICLQTVFKARFCRPSSKIWALKTQKKCQKLNEASRKRSKKSTQKREQDPRSSKMR